MPHVPHRRLGLAALICLLAGCNTPLPGVRGAVQETSLTTERGKAGPGTAGAKPGATTPGGTSAGTKGDGGAAGDNGGAGAGGTGPDGTGPNGTGPNGTGPNGTGTGTGGTGTGPNGTTGGTGSGTAGTGEAGGGSPAPAVNPANGLPFNTTTGGLGRGTVTPAPGDTPVPKVSVNPALGTVTTSVHTADGAAANYIFAGNTIFVEAQGLTAGMEYRATLNWPGGRTVFQDFKADEAGNMVGPQGKFIEYPHAGFFKIPIKVGQNNVIAGQYSVDVAEKVSGVKALNIPFAVKARPIMFCRDKDLNERTLYFSDQSEQVFLHGEGFPPDTKVLVWLVKAAVNRLTPMEDGMVLTDKVFEGKKELAFQTDANGIIDAPLLAWFTRDRVEDPLVLVAKYLNSEPTYVAAEDVVISDHPTFLIKTTKEYFGAINGAVGGPSGVPGATPAP